MLAKTRAIVIHTTKFNDKDLILHALTEEFGMVSYMIYNPWSKQAKVKASYLQTFSLLEIDVEHQPKKDIQRIHDAKILFVGNSIHTNPYKQSIVLFLAEMVRKTLSETEKDVHLFAFVYHSLCVLDEVTEKYNSFHLIFLMRLTQFLGFYPNSTVENNDVYFDMLNGIFTAQPPLHGHYLEGENCKHFQALTHISYTDMPAWNISRVDKLILLSTMVRYYQLHIPTIQRIKSMDILHSLFV